MPNNKGLITIRDVARVAGVSLGSVSRVLNQHASVTREVRTKVQSAIEELGYHPNTAAQIMRGRVTRTVGCVIRDINIPGLAAFVRAAQDVFLEAGYALLLTNSEGKRERERQLLSVMVARQADALLIAHYSERDTALLEQLHSANIPVVLMDREIPEWADAVQVDHRSAIRRATEMLIHLGHRKIALLTGTEALFPARERIIGFREAHEHSGRSVDESLVVTGSFEAAFGFEQTTLLLAAPEPPTAIITGGIEMLPGVLHAIRRRRLSIPRDISLVGTLDSSLAELFDPPIMVENWDYAEVGRLAARFALERIEAPAGTPPKRIMISSDIIMRASCGPPPRG